jgi:formylglycine-generating enzyme required for sulfatase activity
VSITWLQAMAYAEWMGGSLPTYAQWAYAARGPEGVIYPWGSADPVCELANMVGCGGLLPVGPDERAGGASWVGALDMAGNAAEWTADWAGEDASLVYPDGALDPTGPLDGSERIVSGGSWNDPGVVAQATFFTTRDPQMPATTVGVRVVLPATADAEPQDGG